MNELCGAIAEVVEFKSMGAIKKAFETEPPDSLKFFVFIHGQKYRAEFCATSLNVDLPSLF